MKTIQTVILFLLLHKAAFAQSSVNALSDTLLNRYNRADFQGFYNQGSSQWKRNNKKEDILNVLVAMKANTGQIGQVEFSRRSGDTTWYTWNGQKKMVSLVLKSSGGIFDDFDFAVYQFPPSPSLWQKVPNDNPLGTHLDSAVQQVMVDFMLTHKLIGVSVGLVKDGKKYFYNYGAVEKGKKQLPNQNTIYELASVTKTFTGILLAQAVLDEKIKLSDDIRLYMGRNYSNLQYKDKPIRVVNLANHTSGLPLELPNLDNYKNSFEVVKMYDHYTDDSFFADLRRVTIDTVPGTTFSYSNAGVKLLGIILSKTYGKSYNKLLQQYICLPLEMKHTTTALRLSDTASYTKGYDGLGNLMPHVNFNMFGGAGGMLSSTHDMANYIAANINEEIPAVKLAHQQTFSNAYGALGLCWQITKTVNGIRIWKSGGALGFRSYCAVVPEKQIGVIWLSNRSDVPEDDLSDMADRLFQAALK